jgi:hypothetical protein
MLPAGPEWKCKPWTMDYETKNKISLYYCDLLECLKMILFNPLFKDHLHFTPLQLFKTAAKAMRVYTEWMTGDTAWSMQVSFIEL